MFVTILWMDNLMAQNSLQKMLAIQSPVWLSPSRLHGLTPQVADHILYLKDEMIIRIQNHEPEISGQWNKKVRNLSYGSSIILETLLQNTLQFENIRITNIF